MNNVLSFPKYSSCNLAREALHTKKKYSLKRLFSFKQFALGTNSKSSVNWTSNNNISDKSTRDF